MSIAKRGDRRVVVDGTTYLWRIRRTATAAQAHPSASMGIGIQSTVEGARGVLVVDTAIPRPRNGRHVGAVTPEQVRDMIRRALAAGWEPMHERMELRYALHVGLIGPALPPREVVPRKVGQHRAGRDTGGSPTRPSARRRSTSTP